MTLRRASAADEPERRLDLGAHGAGRELAVRGIRLHLVERRPGRAGALRSVPKPSVGVLHVGGDDEHVGVERRARARRR